MSKNHSKCSNCKFFFEDSNVGYSECLKCDSFTDEEFDKYEEYGYLKKCPYFKKDTRSLIEPPDEEISDNL